MKDQQKLKKEKTLRRQRRTRIKIKKTSQKHRLSVFRSHKHIYAQVIDDRLGKTIVSASDHELKGKKLKTDVAFEVGKLIAKKCQEKKIDQIVFDKGAYKFHGRVSNLAKGAREAGLKL